MIISLKFPKSFWTGVTIVKATTKFLWDSLILASHQHRNRTVVVVQIIFRGEAVNEHQMHRKNRHVILPDIGQSVVRSEQNNASNLVGMSASQISCYAGTERLTHKIHRTVCGKQLKHLVSRLEQTALTRRTRTVRIPGIFHNEHVKRCDSLNDIRIMSTNCRTTTIAVCDQHLPRCRLLE